MKNQSNEVFNYVRKNIVEIDNQVTQGCALAKEVKENYEDWTKNAMSKEVVLKLKNSVDKWKRRYGDK